MIVHVWKRAVEANVGKVLVAAAENEIANVIRGHGGDALATDPALRSGTDRVAAALKLRDPQGNFTAVVVLQGDLPTIDPLAIQRCLAGLTNETVDIATIAARLESDAGVRNPNIVKAIAPLGEGREVAYARDFVRSPGPEHDAPFWRHISVYAYRREALDRFASLPVSTREAIRNLEQLRALDNDLRMAVVRVDSVPLAVSAPADLEAARLMLRKKS
jgi:3-deoxy-manno-octulosonate cytidylyltransferase (CMP-KDO synthetase)